MSRGTIRRRGKQSWELKFDLGTDAVAGKRRTRYVTVHGRRQDAQKELTRLLGQADAGTFVDPSQVTVADHMRAWIKAAEIAPKTRERYLELAENQIIPHLGSTRLQKLRPVEIKAWHTTLLATGGKKGGPLAPRTVGHAHRLLRTALQSALRDEIVSRNVASVHSPPKVADEEVEILQPQELAAVLARLAGRDLHVIASMAVGTGMRRGELLALPWSCVDLEKARVSVERSLEETEDGLRFKEPKTRNGRRIISLPASVVALLGEHRRKQLELRMQLGLGKPPADALVFCQPAGSPLSPDWLSWTWRNVCRDAGLPSVNLHALRHTHASALIAAGIDVVKISKRLGHASPTVTLRIYAHLFNPADEAAAIAIDAVMR